MTAEISRSRTTASARSGSQTLASSKQTTHNHQVFALPLGIVEIIEVVKDSEPVAFAEEALAKMTPDEASAAGHKNIHDPSYSKDQ